MTKNHKSGLRILSISATCFTLVAMVTGTGTLLEPPSRGVMWKEGFQTKTNYNYMQQNCGGVKQDELGRRQCGVCGDPPTGGRPHELGQKYGTATISRYFKAGVKEISVRVELQAFEKGFFEFRICPANNKSVTQECLNQNLLPIKEGYFAGMPMRYYPTKAGDFRMTIAVPPKMTCNRCVLQWRYRTANSWGTDPISKEEAIGNGPQEEFYNCADIRIGGEVPESVLNNPVLSGSVVGTVQGPGGAGDLPVSVVVDSSLLLTGDLSDGSGSPTTTNIVTGGTTSFTSSTTATGDLTPRYKGATFDTVYPDMQRRTETTVVGAKDPTIVGVQESARIGDLAINDLSVIGIQDPKMEGAQDIAMTSAHDGTMIGGHDRTMIGTQDRSMIGAQDRSIIGSQDRTIIGTQDGTIAQDSTMIGAQDPTIIGLQDPLINGPSIMNIQDSKMISVQDTTVSGSKDSTMLVQEPTLIGSQDTTMIAAPNLDMVGVQETMMRDIQSPTVTGVQDIIGTGDATVTGFQEPFIIGKQDSVMTGTKGSTMIGVQDRTVIGVQDPIIMGSQDPTITDVPNLDTAGALDTATRELQSPSLTGVQSTIVAGDPAIVGLQDPSIISNLESTLAGAQASTAIGVQGSTVLDVQGPKMVGSQGSSLVRTQDTISSNVQAPIVTGAKDTAGFENPVSVGLQDPPIMGIQDSWTGGAKDSTMIGVQGSTVLDIQDPTMIDSQDPTLVLAQDTIRRDTPPQIFTGVQDTVGFGDPAITGLQDPSIMDIRDSAMTGAQDSTLFSVKNSRVIGVQDLTMTGSQDPTMIAVSNPNTVGIQDTIISDIQAPTVVEIQDNTVVRDPAIAGLQEPTMFGTQNQVGFQDPIMIGTQNPFGVQDSSVFDLQKTSRVGIQDASSVGVPDTSVVGLGDSTTMIDPRDPTLTGIRELTSSTDATGQTVELNNVSANVGKSVIYTEGGSVSVNKGAGKQEVIETGLIGVEPQYIDGNSMTSGPSSFEIAANQNIRQATASSTSGLDKSSLTLDSVRDTQSIPQSFDNSNQLSTGLSIANGETTTSLITQDGISSKFVEPIVKPTGLVSGGEVQKAKTFIGHSTFPIEQSVSEHAVGQFMQAKKAGENVLVDSSSISGTALSPVGIVDPSMKVKTTESLSGSLGNIDIVSSNVGSTAIGINTIGGIKESRPSKAPTVPIMTAKTSFTAPDASRVKVTTSMETSDIMKVDLGVPAVLKSETLPVLPKVKATLHIEGTISNQIVQRAPTGGAGVSTEVTKETVAISMKDPFEHLPAQSLAVIPLEPETKAVQTNKVLGKETISNELTVQRNLGDIVGGNIDLNLIEIKPLDGVGLPTIFGDVPVGPAAVAKGPMKGETKVMELVQKAAPQSTSGFGSNRVVDLRDLQSKDGSGETSIKTLKSGASLRAGIEIQSDKVKNGNTAKDVPLVNMDLVGSGISVISNGKQPLGQKLSSDSNKTGTVVFTQPPRPRFRFVRDPRTGMMTRVAITSKSDSTPVADRSQDRRRSEPEQRGQFGGRARSEMDLLRRISTPRDGTLPPDYLMEGARRRGGFSSRIARGDSRSPIVGRPDFRPSPMSPFGDTSGRRPIFPFGMGGGSAPGTVMRPGLVGDRERDIIGSRTGTTFVAGSTRGRRRGGTQDRTRSGSGTIVRSFDADTSVSRDARTGTRSEVGTRGDSGRSRTVLFLRPGGESRIVSAGRSGTRSGGLTDVRRRTGFGAPSGLNNMGGVPVVGRGPAVTGRGTSVVGGAMGDAPGMDMTSGAFFSPAFGGLGSFDMSGMFGTEMGPDFFPMPFGGPFGPGGVSPFSPFTL